MLTMQQTANLAAECALENASWTEAKAARTFGYFAIWCAINQRILNKS